MRVSQLFWLIRLRPPLPLGPRRLRGAGADRNSGVVRDCASESLGIRRYLDSRTLEHVEGCEYGLRLWVILFCARGRRFTDARSFEMMWSVGRTQVPRGESMRLSDRRLT